MTSRRAFVLGAAGLAGILVANRAPLVVRQGVLMPVAPRILTPHEILMQGFAFIMNKDGSMVGMHDLSSSRAFTGFCMKNVHVIETATNAQMEAARLEYLRGSAAP